MAVKGSAGRRVVVHLILVNATAIILDIVPLLALWSKYWAVSVQLNSINMPFWCVSSSIKLKMEFGVLNKLWQLLEAPVEHDALRESHQSDSQQAITRNSRERHLHL
ncbi:uncharacterized protein BDV14DRAFT_168333 [Aspergillus stella-maris]|uniref:uncharacterized protein n=1 Tax=Aspergillus stella-maris TaxID=1810926 RepID=UPI003CCE2214